MHVITLMLVTVILALSFMVIEHSKPTHRRVEVEHRLLQGNFFCIFNLQNLHPKDVENQRITFDMFFFINCLAITDDKHLNFQITI